MWLSASLAIGAGRLSRVRRSCAACAPSRRRARLRRVLAVARYWLLAHRCPRIGEGDPAIVLKAVQYGPCCQRGNLAAGISPRLSLVDHKARSRLALGPRPANFCCQLCYSLVVLGLDRFAKLL